MRLSVLLPVAGLLVACATEAPSLPPSLDPPEATTRQPIRHGVPDHDHPAVVEILLYDGESFDPGGEYYICSATIVAAEGTQAFALTAAHCAGGVAGGPKPREVVVGESLATGTHHPITSYLPNAGFSGSTYDFGMIAFERPTPDVTPIPVLTPDLDQVGVGSSVRFVGYGIDENEVPSIRRQVDGVVQNVAAEGQVTDGLHLVFGRNADQGIPCAGDSGGPALVTVNGTEHVAGVISGGDEACTVGYAGRVSAVVESFIKPFLAGGPVVQTCTECVNTVFGEQTGCFTKAKACLANAACKALDACLHGCTTSDCREDCVVDHAAGVALYNGANACLCQQCTDPCTSECSVPATSGGIGQVTPPETGGSGGGAGNGAAGGGAGGTVAAGSAGSSGSAGVGGAGIAGAGDAGAPVAAGAGGQAVSPAADDSSGGSCSLGHGAQGSEVLGASLLALALRRRRRRDTPRV